MFANGEGEEVVLGKHVGQTAVVCDHSRDDAKVTSEFYNAVFLVKEACIAIIGWVASTKAPGYAPTDRIVNVAVRNRNKADKPIDFRSDPRLSETRTRNVVNRNISSAIACKMKNSQKQERDNHPGQEENANCIVFHPRVGLVCIGNTRVGDENGREGQPECTIRCERYVQRGKKKSC